ncbi:MAG: FMN-binding protein, partial [Wenzhouxiangella sp.]
GSRIVDDEDFVEGFTRIELQFAGGQLKPLAVREEAVHEQGEIDAMTGATVSVDAVADIINASLAEWLELLDAHYDELAGDGRG